MKKKLALTLAFAASLIPMLFVQYGGHRGVQEVSGLINLTNPIGILSVCAFLLGVWLPLKGKGGWILGAVGVVGMVIAELYAFLTWHIPNITGAFSLRMSFRLAYPTFYLGLALSLLMVVGYFVEWKQQTLQTGGGA